MLMQHSTGTRIETNFKLVHHPATRKLFAGHWSAIIRRVQKKGPRSTVKLFISLVLITLCCVCYTTYAQPQFQNPSATDLPIIDAHTHTDFSGGPERTSGIAKTEAQYFKEWREAGVVGAVAPTRPVGGDFHDWKNRNVVYCAGVGITIDAAGIESGLKSGKYGCI